MNNTLYIETFRQRLTVSEIAIVIECVYNNLYLCLFYFIGPNQPKVPQPSTVPVIPANNAASNLNALLSKQLSLNQSQSQPVQQAQSPAPQAAQLLKFIPETELSLGNPLQM